MRYLAFIFLYLCTFDSCNNEVPLSSCMELKPMKTTSNTCASFNDVCLKKGDTDCDSFVNVCKQCPPNNITLSIMADMFKILKVQYLLSKEMAKSKPTENVLMTLVIIVIVLVVVNILIVLVENRFKLCTKICRNCSRPVATNRYKIIESRKYGIIQENNRKLIEELGNQIKSLKDEFWKLSSNIIEMNLIKFISGRWLILESIFHDIDSFIIEHSNSDSVLTLKRKIKEKRKDTNDKFLFLFYNGAYLENDKILSEYNITNKSIMKYCQFRRMDDRIITIGPLLFTGNTSEIFKGTVTSPIVEIVIKKYKCSDISYLKESKALRTELSSIGKLECVDRFVKLLGFYTDDHFMYVTMEYMAGGSLKNQIQNHFPLREENIRSWTMQILQGLSYLHANNVCHGDLKPFSILLDQENHVKIYSFDFTKYWMETTDKFVEEIHKNKSLPYRYMSPDALVGDLPLINADDIWSFGAVLVEIVTGVHPYPNFVDNFAAQEICESKTIIYELPSGGRYDEWCKIIDLCLKTPDKRPTADDLLHTYYQSNTI